MACYMEKDGTRQWVSDSVVDDAKRNGWKVLDETRHPRPVAIDRETGLPPGAIPPASPAAAPAAEPPAPDNSDGGASEG